MSIPDVHYFDITELGSLVSRRELSSREITRRLLDRIASVDGRLHSYSLLMSESALAEADAADAEIASGQLRGPLHGVPIAVKDLVWTKSCPTSAGMAILKEFRPHADATVV